MFLAQVLHNNAELVFIWDVNDACPGHYLQVFKPIPGVNFIQNSSRGLFEPYSEKTYPMTRNGFVQTMLDYDVNLIVRKNVWWQNELAQWENILPIRELEEKVETYVSQHRICNITSMHLRRTDMDIELKPKQRAASRQFYAWVERQPADEPVYMMTDNLQTQTEFFNKYGAEKILVYANITSIDQQKPIQSYYNPKLASEGENRTKLAIDHRFTTLEHAVIDVLIAAHARDFRPSAFSSVSELVKYMNYLHRYHWCGCLFRGC